MIDDRLRRAGRPLLDRAGTRLVALGVRPGWLTGAGWVLGVAACVAAAFGAWHLALVGWLANRVLDGLDGPVARVQAASRRGAFADLAADFSIYGGFVVGVAVARPDARLACTVVLAACYVAGATYAALSSLLDRRLIGGIAEGAETVVAYVAVCLAPDHAAVILWVFGTAVALTAVQRVVAGLLALPGCGAADG